jgi:menaquinone-dependent protoporphyrinogen IX oxidase
VDTVDLKRQKVLDLAPYGAVIVGTGVRMGMVYRKGKAFLRRKDLAGKQVSIFLSSGMAVDDAEGSRDKFLAPLVEGYGLSPVMYDAFPGRMPVGPGKVEDRTEPDIARRWAEELADRMDACGGARGT